MASSRSSMPGRCLAAAGPRTPGVALFKADSLCAKPQKCRWASPARLCASSRRLPYGAPPAIERHRSGNGRMIERLVYFRAHAHIFSAPWRNIRLMPLTFRMAMAASHHRWDIGAKSMREGRRATRLAQSAAVTAFALLCVHIAPESGRILEPQLIRYLPETPRGRCNRFFRCEVFHPPI
jgi:hypothetical protein